MRATIVVLAACLVLASAQTLQLPDFSQNERISTELDANQQSIFMEEHTIPTNFDGTDSPMTLVRAVGPDNGLKALIQSKDKLTMLSATQGCQVLESTEDQPVAFIPDAAAFADYTGPKRQFFFGYRDLVNNHDLSSAEFNETRIFRGISCNVFTVANIQKAGVAYDATIYAPDSDWTWFNSDNSDKWLAAVELNGILCASRNETCDFDSANATADSTTFTQWYNFFFPLTDTGVTNPSLDLGLLAFCPLDSSSDSSSVAAPVFPETANAQVLVTKVGSTESVLTWEAWKFVTETTETSSFNLTENGWIVKTNAGFADQSIFAVAFSRNLTFTIDPSYGCNETDSSDTSIELVNEKTDNVFGLPEALTSSNYAKRLLSSSPLTIHGLIDLYLIGNQLNLTYNGQRLVRDIACNSWFASFDVPVVETASPPSNDTEPSSAVVQPSASAEPEQPIATPTIKARQYLLIMDFAIADWTFTSSNVAVDSPPVRFQLLEMSTDSSGDSSSTGAFNWNSDEINDATTSGLIVNNWIFDIFSISGDVVGSELALPEFAKCKAVLSSSSASSNTTVYPELAPSFISFISMIDTVTPAASLIQTWYDDDSDALRFSFYDNLELSVAKIIWGTSNQLNTLEPSQGNSADVCNSEDLPASLNPFLTPDQVANQTSTVEFSAGNDLTPDEMLQELVLPFGRLDLVNASLVGERTLFGRTSQYWLGYDEASNLWFGFYFLQSNTGDDAPVYVPVRLEVSQLALCDSGAGGGLCSDNGILPTSDKRSYTVHRYYDFFGLSTTALIPNAVFRPLECGGSNASSAIVSASASVAPASSSAVVEPSGSPVESEPVDEPPIDARRRDVMNNLVAQASRTSGRPSHGFGMGAVAGIAVSTLLVGTVIGGAIVLTYRRRRETYSPMYAVSLS
ncbi:hypothetical protein, variant [Capsaspora owczarzaki ATCC 30864]|nr:hypothetical protein CAOG_04345 [Capsaspora owczarzaki ATCC 30864]XP_011270374.1 hypothetical protein, variant [Capsaspora owczarzaki ATCC 30864]KJE93579.1 hypothetical protein, variant 1 [Capsaspora owczarzaki ATCC 30864]KJE93580.1 hypothetical protein, variant 2 [Capsaspora owczarzaki ATCC 30864]|eukprot:XP_004348173.1 hypothetical protein CAOG_04345 [Capsaspora owczarzaki ATCC 30864]